MGLLKDGRYELRGSRGLVRDFRKTLIEEFEERDFEHRMHVDAPRAPEVNQFGKDDAVVMISCEKTGEDYLLAIETETPVEELEELIVDAAAQELVNYAGRLFAGFEPPQQRESLERLVKAFSSRVKRVALEAE